MIATRNRGSASATAMAARSPAPPPPTTSTSWTGPASAAMVRAVQILHGLSIMSDGPHMDAAIVVLVADAAASAGVVLVADDQAVVVVIQEVIAIDGLSAGGLFVVEGDPCANHLLLSHCTFGGGLSQCGRPA